MVLKTDNRDVGVYSGSPSESGGQDPVGTVLTSSGPTDGVGGKGVPVDGRATGRVTLVYV